MQKQTDIDFLARSERKIYSDEKQKKHQRYYKDSTSRTHHYFFKKVQAAS